MKTNKLLIISGVALATALCAALARTAATSRISGGGTYSAEFGGKVPVPPEYTASARRLRDESGAPQEVLLFAAGNEESAWARSSRLDDGSVLIEAMPFDDARSVLKKAKRLPGGVSGMPYPAFATATAGRITVAMVTPKRLVRVSAARWTTAFDRVVRGFRDEA